MITIGIIREGKSPADNRVALTPTQCKWIGKQHPGVRVKVQSAPGRCFSDAEYRRAGVEVVSELTDADVLFGIKEVPPQQLIAGKTYLFFSHTKKKQPHNRSLLQTVLERKIRLVDYECLLHDDGQRIIGFGFFAGIVGAHNGMMVYGNRTHTFALGRVHQHKTFRKLMHTYFGLDLPNVKVVVTGSGRVAQGALEIMNLMQIREVEKEEFLEREFSYPVYVHLKGSDLYRRRDGKPYSRKDFHSDPLQYESTFGPFTKASDILMNGVYWDLNVPRLFEEGDVKDPAFRIQVIADITDDTGGSVPINLGDQSIADPVYGVDRQTLQKTAPYQTNSIDVMAVGNLPNELPRDASRYFGEQLLKYVLPDLMKGGSGVITRATIAESGKLTDTYSYLQDYVDVAAE
ncbi:MAG: alanine dehydrogenase [Sphingobacteriales bacterium]|nr:MAG: alanine dehydrogenase [Sphingobacteriales bacterium]